MAEQTTGAEALAEILREAQERLEGECINERSRTCCRAAIAIASAPVARDGWIRQAVEARQWLKESRDFDTADSNRKLAEMAREAEEKKSRAQKRAAMRKRRTLRAV